MNRRTAAVFALLPIICFDLHLRYEMPRWQEARRAREMQQMRLDLKARKAQHKRDAEEKLRNELVSVAAQSAGPADKFSLTGSGDNTYDILSFTENAKTAARNRIVNYTKAFADTRMPPEVTSVMARPPQEENLSLSGIRTGVWQVAGHSSYYERGNLGRLVMVSWETRQRFDARQNRWEILDLTSRRSYAWQ